MRIVAIADTHTFEADLGVLPEGDLLIHAGDLVRGGELAELAPVAAWLRRQPHRYKIVVAGNHDRCFERVEDRDAAIELLGPEITYLEDSAVEIEGLRFWGSPWQPAYNNWAFNLRRGAAIAQKWALIPDGTDILITHGPPEGLGDRSSDQGRHGCADLRLAVNRVRPLLHFFGHIHQDGGVFVQDGTIHVNATTWECEREPTVVDVDPGTRVVRIVRCPPTEAQRASR